MMKLVHARAGEQRTISAKTSAKNRFMNMIAMQLPLGMRKYIINALPSSPERLLICDPFCTFRVWVGSLY
jgi:hypothetical protein